MGFFVCGMMVGFVFTHRVIIMNKLKIFVITNIITTGFIFSQDGWEHQWWGTPDFFAVSAS